jgi:putative Mg2+ transporter-C (MgtC) family protein
MQQLLVQLIGELQAMRWDLAMDIFLAGVLGGVIGLEREWHGHPAGLRTNMLVALGSCLFTILSIEGFPLRGTAQDSARIAAQIVTGIGFLGAGALFHNKSNIRGMTTAATIWLVAAIGMAVGASMYFIAVITTLMTAVVLVVLRPLSTRLSGRRRRQRQQKGELLKSVPKSSGEASAVNTIADRPIASE